MICAFHPGNIVPFCDNEVVFVNLVISETLVFVRGYVHYILHIMLHGYVYFCRIALYYKLENKLNSSLIIIFAYWLISFKLLVTEKMQLLDSFLLLKVLVRLHHRPVCGAVENYINNKKKFFTWL